jgi:hypothetical protein
MPHQNKSDHLGVAGRTWNAAIPIDAGSILADLKAKREVRGPVLHFKDYWRTYGLMVIYGVAFVVLDFRFQTRAEAMQLYLSTAVLVATAVRDGQRAINWRFEHLVDLLEKNGSL